MQELASRIKTGQHLKTNISTKYGLFTFWPYSNISLMDICIDMPFFVDNPKINGEPYGVQLFIDGETYQIIPRFYKTHPDLKQEWVDENTLPATVTDKFKNLNPEDLTDELFGGIGGILNSQIDMVEGLIKSEEPIKSIIDRTKKSLTNSSKSSKK